MIKVTCYGMCDACQNSGNCEIQKAEMDKKQQSRVLKIEQKTKWDKYLQAALEPDIW